MFVHAPVMLGPVPVDFILFAMVLAGIALFHRHTFQVAITGLVAITLYKLAFTGFAQGPGLGGLAGLLAHEWVTLANLFLLLMGFALLSRHFEDSNIPVELPRILPDDWKGGFLLLVMVFVISSFLDNIAAALIGGTMAAGVFRKKIHIGYLAAIVAASNAGGSGSVIGDTTTTMMWIDGVKPIDVLEAYVGAGTALAIFGVAAARQQQAYSPIMKDAPAGVRIDWTRAGTAPGRLRLGISCLCGRLRRLDDLVRILGGRGPRQQFPRGQERRAVGQARLACGARICRRLLRAPCRPRMAPGREAAQGRD